MNHAFSNAILKQDASIIDLDEDDHTEVTETPSVRIELNDEDDAMAVGEQAHGRARSVGSRSFARDPRPELKTPSLSKLPESSVLVASCHENVGVCSATLACVDIGPSAKSLGNDKDNLHNQDGHEPLTWAVVRPHAPGAKKNDSNAPRHAASKRDLIATDVHAQSGAGERAMKRMRELRLARARASNSGEVKTTAARAQLSVADSERCSDLLRERATQLLQAAFGKDPDAAATKKTSENADIAAAIVGHCIQKLGATVARRHLLSLVAALRTNDDLRTELLVAGANAAGQIVVRQDPRTWASAELRAKRQQWMQESLQEVKPAGPVGTCPVCGGRAVVHTGTAGSGRSGRLTKAFYHYSCLEEACGQQSHVKQD